ncbi:lung adenoma susceptibility protein 2 [Pogona vitticeps]
MACLVKKEHAHSPESTVSSLLASCSLNSSSGSLNSNSSFQYKDKLYKSASQALEAYIEDFDLGLASSDIRPGKICITSSTPKDLRYSEDNFKCKHVLGSYKQCEKPVSLVPYQRRKIADELDVLSLTTDDLLAFPADGSVSFTQSGALRTAPLTSNLKKKSFTESASQICHQTSSFGHKEVNFTDSSLCQDSSRRVHTKHKFCKHDSGLPIREQPVVQGDSESVSHRNYPRWLTSQKTDLSISGISSIPDFRYPVWLKNHHLLPDSSNENSALPQNVECDPTFLHSNKKLIKKETLDRPITSAYPGNDDVLGLQYNQDVSKSSQYDASHACFAPQPLKGQRDPFQDDGTDSLLQKPWRTLKSSEELNAALKNDGSPCTVDILEAERSWDNVPVGLRSPVPVCCEDENSVQSPKANIVNGFLEDCLKNSSQESTFSGGNHHGPVEALKLMLFNLQAVQHSFNQNKTAGQKEEFKKTLDEDGEFKLCDSDMMPIRQSLQRALHHLSRLKCLVEDTGDKEESKEYQDRKDICTG